MFKVSIIIPVYNVEQYLEKCLDSVVNQTLQNIEIICINDGSTDKCLDILDKYASNDNRIVVISQENRGQGIARNRGIELAQGEYIQFIDPDDWIELNTTELLYNYSKKYNADYTEFLFDRYLEDKNDFYVPQPSPYKENILYSNKNFEQNALEMPLLTWNKFFKREFLIKNNIRYDDSKLGEDHIVTIKARILAQRIVFFNQALYHYRVNPNSSCNSISNTKLEIFDVITRLKNELVQLGKFDSIKNNWSDYIINFVLWNCHSVPQESIKEFDNKCKELLSQKEYKKYKKLRNGSSNTNLLKTIFSITNNYSGNKKYKVITILGIKIKFKSAKAQ